MARREEITVWIGGAAGDGIASAGESFAKACSRLGLHVFAYNSYQSVIRGGHVCMHMRVSSHPVETQGDTCDFLIALNMDTVLRYGKRVQPQGAVVFNADKLKVTPELLGDGAQACGLPVMALTKNTPLMQNIVALGVLMHLLGLSTKGLDELLRERFQKKGEPVITQNLEAMQAGMAYAQTHFTVTREPLKGDGKRRLLMAGNPAMGLGALAAGCRFYSAYPMTPASSLLHWLVKYATRTGLLVKQCEDEIAALNMAIGAAHVGVRAMTGTSGGGFSLMTEAVGEAGMTETPVVIVLAMRGGPSTGLPTKTEQGDLFQALGASQGEFPKVILAPRTVEECYATTIEAFNLAEKYQCPVILLTDLYLAESLQTVEGLDIKHIPIDRGELRERWDNGETYRRFHDTETGVSPRVLPGTAGICYVSATDEHDEDGIVISDVFTHPAKRQQMMEKRMRKLAFLVQELPKPAIEGPAHAELTLVGWGSTYSIIRETMHALNQEGFKVNMLVLRNLWPFQDTEVAQLLRSCKVTMSVEGNFTGQLVQLIRMRTGLLIQHHLRKYDGEPFEPGQVIAQARKILVEKPTQTVVATVVSDEGLPGDFSPVTATHA